MIEKIKAFFASKVTKIVAFVVLVLAAVVLILGGVATDSITNVVLLAAGVVDALAVLVTAIAALIKK